MKFQRAQRGATAIYSLTFTLRTRGLAGELQLDPIEHKPAPNRANPAQRIIRSPVLWLSVRPRRRRSADLV
jgi:hypothetical protein